MLKTLSSPVDWYLIHYFCNWFSWTFHFEMDEAMKLMCRSVFQDDDDVEDEKRTLKPLHGLPSITSRRGKGMFPFRETHRSAVYSISSSVRSLQEANLRNMTSDKLERSRAPVPCLIKPVKHG